MSGEQAVRDALARAASLGVVVSGMRPNEVRGVEVAYRCALPATFRLWLELAGFSPSLLLGGSFGMTELFALPRAFAAAAAADPALAVALTERGRCVPFRRGSGGVLWWLAGDGDDPPVLGRHPGRRDPLHEVAPTLGAAVQQLVDRAASRFGLPTPPDLVPGDLPRMTELAEHRGARLYADTDPEWPYVVLMGLRDPLGRPAEGPAAVRSALTELLGSEQPAGTDAAAQAELRSQLAQWLGLDQPGSDAAQEARTVVRGVLESEEHGDALCAWLAETLRVGPRPEAVPRAEEELRAALAGRGDGLVHRVSISSSTSFGAPVAGLLTCRCLEEADARVTLAVVAETLGHLREL